jgi:hypothetical protein
MFPTAEWWDQLLVPGLVPTSRIKYPQTDDLMMVRGFVHGYRNL